MAKSYTINTELNGKSVEVGLQKINSLVRATSQEANSLNKAMKISGDLSAGTRATEGLQKALKLATDRSASLKAALDKAKMDGSSANTVADLTAKLARSDAEANNLKNSLAEVNNEGAKSGGSMLDTFSKLGNIASGATAVFNVLKDTIGAVIGKGIELAKTFGSEFMKSYDQLATSNLTLKNTLKDGEKGLADYNAEMKKAPALVRAQKSELDQMAATMAAYGDVTGKEAFEIANAINAVGDSVGANIDQQKGFTTALGQAMTAGKLMAQDFNQMSQTALGKQFKNALIDAKNELSNVGITSEQVSEKLKKGEYSAKDFSAVFGSDWAKNMAKAMESSTGLKTNVSMVNDALKSGKISTEQLSQVLGGDYLEKLTAAANANKEGAVTSETFRQAMEDGAFTSDVLQAALGKLIEQGEKVPQVFTTFEQVKMSIQNAFYTGAVEAFLEKMVGSKDKLNEFGQAATEFAQNAGAQLGSALGIAAQKVGEFIDANGGISGVMNTMTEWVTKAGKVLQSMAEDVLVVIGNVLSLTKTRSELEKMGFKYDELGQTIVGWSAKSEGAKKKQQEVTNKIQEAMNPLGQYETKAKNAAKATGNLEQEGERGKRGIDKTKNALDNALPSFTKAEDGAKKAAREISNIPSNTYVNVDTSGAVSNLSWLISWTDTASARLRGLNSNVGNYGRQIEMRDDSGKINPLIASNYGALRASQLYGSLEHYSAANAATRRQPPPPPTRSTNFGSGAIQISVTGGNTDKAVAELEAKLRRLGIRIN